MKKKWIIIGGVVIVLCIIIVLVLCLTGNKNKIPNSNIEENYYSNQSGLNADDINYSSEYVSETTKIENEVIEYEDLKVTNFEAQMTSSDYCEIRATVQNMTDNLIEMKYVRLIITNDDGTVDEIGAQIDSLAANKTTTMYTKYKRKTPTGIKSITIESK